MTRIPRSHIEGAVFYATSRGDNNENIFKEEPDYSIYLGLLKKYRQRYGFRLFAFCLLPNHLHLLVGLKEKLTISEILHDLNTSYTKYFNGKYNRKGHLFQERCKLNILEKEPYLLLASGYIHLNGAVLKLSAGPEDYAYSSYNLYPDVTKSEKILLPAIKDLVLSEEISEVSVMLKGVSYAQYLGKISAREMQEFAAALSKEVVLGGTEFLKKVELIREENDKPGVEEEVVAGAGRFTPLKILALAFLGVLAITLFIRGMVKYQQFQKEVKIREAQMDLRLKNERQRITKDLEEKYHADQVSYQAMSKRLEIEKKRFQELEGRVKK